MTHSARLPVLGVVSTTYLTRGAAKSALDGVLGQLIPGLSGGRTVSGAAAQVKRELLQYVASHYYSPVNFDQHFDGDLEYVSDAIVYASQKKGTKGDRQLIVAAAENVAGIAGGIIGGAAGSVAMPVAGTVGGATIGVVAGKGAVGVGYQLFRKAKWVYKKVKGTQGVHRNEAAAILYSAAVDGQGTDKLAATAALLIILGDEYEHFMGKPDLAVERIANRLKSV
jgi:hypothetical protein